MPKKESADNKTIKPSSSSSSSSYTSGDKAAAEKKWHIQALSNPLTQGMGDKQGARLIRLLYARAYKLPRVWKALGLGNFLDEKERKRCPGYTAESMAAEDAAEAAAAHGESRDVDRDHWIPEFCKERALMMAQVNCELPTTSLWEYNIDCDNILYALTLFRLLIVIGVGETGTYFFHSLELRLDFSAVLRHELGLAGALLLSNYTTHCPSPPTGGGG